MCNNDKNGNIASQSYVSAIGSRQASIRQIKSHISEELAGGHQKLKALLPQR
jgi:hypothetical protein